jgi:hypothetical protein
LTGGPAYVIIYSNEGKARYAMKSQAVYFLILALLCASAAGRAATIEAENFSGSFNIKGDPIQSNVLAGNGFLSGMDIPGEWVEYTVGIDASAENNLSVRLQGEEGVLFELELTIIPSGGGESRTVSFEYTGTGFS